MALYWVESRHYFGNPCYWFIILGHKSSLLQQTIFYVEEPELTIFISKLDKEQLTKSSLQIRVHKQFTKFTLPKKHFLKEKYV